MSDPCRRHALDFEYMSDSPDEVPIAVKAYCRKCRKEWLFDASVKDDLMPLEARVEKLTAALKTAAGWLVANCESCNTSIGQIEPGLWIHTYGPMIGQVRCNTLHGAESNRAAPDKHWHKRKADAYAKLLQGLQEGSQNGEETRG